MHHLLVKTVSVVIRFDIQITHYSSGSDIDVTYSSIATSPLRPVSGVQLMQNFAMPQNTISPVMQCNVTVYVLYLVPIRAGLVNIGSKLGESSNFRHVCVSGLKHFSRPAP